MSTTYTPNTKLGQPALGDTGWSTPLNANCTTLDGLSPVGGLCVTTYEQPSASLNVAVAAGNYVKQDGTIATYAGAASQAVTASATNYLYLDLTSSGALTVNTTGFPTTAHAAPRGRRRGQLDDYERHRFAAGVHRLRLGARRDRTGRRLDERAHDRHGGYAEARILWQDARRTADDGRRDRGVVIHVDGARHAQCRLFGGAALGLGS